MDPKLKATLSVIATTFVGGIVGYFQTALAGGVPGDAQWKSFAIGALVAGAAAVLHLFQDPKLGGGAQ